MIFNIDFGAAKNLRLFFYCVLHEKRTAANFDMHSRVNFECGIAFAAALKGYISYSITAVCPARTLPVTGLIFFTASMLVIIIGV